MDDPTPLTTIDQEAADAHEQLGQTVAEAGQVLSGGGLVVFPTETVYGIAASLKSEKGYQALLRFKGRDESQPFTIHMPTPAAAERYVDTGDPVMARALQKLLPGPVTLIVDVSDEVIDSKLKALDIWTGGRSRLYHGRTIGLRCPDHPLGRQVLDACPDPIVASSANARGQPPPLDAAAAATAVGDAAAVMVDGGPCRFARPSTIVRLSSDDHGQLSTRVEREGVYDERIIRKLLRWNLLLVCSGNTCRSPMAEVLACQLLADAREVKPEQLGDLGVVVTSAGTYAADGMAASPEAVEAMAKQGLDLSRHRSTALTPELIHEADVIYCMTVGHVKAVLSMVPAAGDKVSTLDPSGDIDDPIGSNSNCYLRCAELIRRRMMQRLKEQHP